MQVALLNGITMGGGVGLSVHAPIPAVGLINADRRKYAESKIRPRPRAKRHLPVINVLEHDAILIWRGGIAARGVDGDLSSICRGCESQC